MSEIIEERVCRYCKVKYEVEVGIGDGLHDCDGAEVVRLRSLLYAAEKRAERLETGLRPFATFARAIAKHREGNLGSYAVVTPDGAANLTRHDFALALLLCTPKKRKEKD